MISDKTYAAALRRGKTRHLRVFEKPKAGGLNVKAAVTGGASGLTMQTSRKVWRGPQHGRHRVGVGSNAFKHHKRHGRGGEAETRLKGKPVAILTVRIRRYPDGVASKAYLSSAME